MISEIDKQLEEMEDELAKLSNALEVIENSKRIAEETTAALKSAQVDYSEASKKAAQALRDCSEQLSSSSNQLLGKIDPLVSEIKKSELGKCNEGIRNLEDRVEKTVIPQIEKLATSDQLRASESLWQDALRTTEKRLGEAHSSQQDALQAIAKSLEAEREQFGRIEKICIAAVSVGGTSLIAALIGIFL